MWRMVRAAFIGIVIGVVGGAMIGQIYYIRYLYHKVQEQQQEAMNALVYNNDSILYEEEIAAGMELYNTGLFSSDEMGQSEEDASLEKKVQTKETLLFPDMIQLEVIYEGDEALSAYETDELRTFVKQAVLYALTEKLGKDYEQSMTKEEIRKNLILSFEYISHAARESALEWGVDVNARTDFDFQYKREEEINGVLYPAGYYEVLNIYLTN